MRQHELLGAMIRGSCINGRAASLQSRYPGIRCQSGDRWNPRAAHMAALAALACVADGAARYARPRGSAMAREEVRVGMRRGFGEGCDRGFREIRSLGERMVAGGAVVVGGEVAARRVSMAGKTSLGEREADIHPLRGVRHGMTRSTAGVPRLAEMVRVREDQQARGARCRPAPCHAPFHRAVMTGGAERWRWVGAPDVPRGDSRMASLTGGKELRVPGVRKRRPTTPLRSQTERKRQHHEREPNAAKDVPHRVAAPIPGSRPSIHSIRSVARR